MIQVKCRRHVCCKCLSFSLCESRRRTWRCGQDSQSEREEGWSSGEDARLHWEGFCFRLGAHNGPQVLTPWKNNAIELNFGQPDFDYWYLLVSTGVPPILLLLMMMMPTKTLGQTWWMRLTPETMAFSGCSITSGVGKGLVVDTGMSTRTLFAQSVLHTGAAED